MKLSKSFAELMYSAGASEQLNFELGVLIGRLAKLVTIIEDDAGREAGPEFCRSITETKTILNMED